MTRGPIPPIPVTVLTGFLGTGKTTLLNRLLKDDLMTGTLVIVNEFGDIGIDHHLIEQTTDDMILMSAGCLCCTIRGDLIQTLENLLRRIDNKKMSPFKRIVLETTGLANPAPILQAIIAHPYLSLRYQLDGLVTLVDTVNGSSTLEHHAEARQQVSCADCLVLTKTDLTSDFSSLTAQLHTLNPFAEVVNGHDIKASQLLGLKLKGFKVQETGVHTHHAHHFMTALSLRADRPLARSRLDLFLDLLRSNRALQILRFKGLINVLEHPSQPLVVQGVQHLVEDKTLLAGWPDQDHTSRLVVIGMALEKKFIEDLWNACLNIPVLDTPDVQALANNPLKV